jgi:hypothetical protein
MTRGRGSRRSRHRAAPESVPECFYVYALLDASVRTTRSSIREVEIVEVGGVAAAVERRRRAPKTTETALRNQHRLVVELGDVADAILPVRFGTLVDRDELERVVGRRRATLRKALRHVRGKRQMTVRVFGGTNTSHVRGTPATGTEYLLARAGPRREDLPAIAASIRNAVGSIVSDERIDAPRGSIQVTMNHLVRRDRLERYESILTSTIAGIKAPQHVTVSGPWPPFAFAPDLFE